MSLVTFWGRVAGNEQVAEVDQSNGSYVVRWAGSTESARSLTRALEIAARHIGEYLRHAWGRQKLPWGLKVEIEIADKSSTVITRGSQDERPVSAT